VSSPPVVKTALATSKQLSTLPQGQHKRTTDSPMYVTDLTMISSTVTITSGSTSTTVLPSLANTVTTRSNLPTYATACGGAATRYASACSCAGVTKTTSTAPIPTATAISPAVDQGCGTGTNYFDGTNARYCSNGSCYCRLRTSGPTTCSTTFGCGGRIICTSDSDCTDGDVCVLGTLCSPDGSTAICAPASAFLACANAASSARLFRKAATPLIGWSDPIGPAFD
jgi:hypothetical protein